MSTPTEKRGSSSRLRLDKKSRQDFLFDPNAQFDTNSRANNSVIFSPLPDGEFEILYADPPWDYKGVFQHSGRGGSDTGGAMSHYPTVKLNDLKKLDVPSITAKNALMFMWSSSPHLDQAIELGKYWGFSWTTVAFVWNKLRTNPGFYTLSQCELCLLFKHGKIPSPRGARNIRQYIEAPRKSHSKKPPEVRDRIFKMFPTQKKIELFAREKAQGWKTWGNEV